MKKFLLSLSIAAMSISAAQAETVYFQEDFEWLEPYAKAGKMAMVNLQPEIQLEQTVLKLKLLKPMHVRSMM